MVGVVKRNLDGRAVVPARQPVARVAYPRRLAVVAHLTAAFMCSAGRGTMCLRSQCGGRPDRRQQRVAMEGVVSAAVPV